MLLPEFGIEKQTQLYNTSVLIVGMGGLGCPAAQYLCSAGVGTIGFADHDRVEDSNIHRQTLYGIHDVGKSKVALAAEKLSHSYPHIKLHAHDLKIGKENVLEIIDTYDIVLDASDNFATRYLLNDACVLKNKIYIYGSVYQYEGQVGVLNFESNNLKCNLRDLYSELPSQNDIPNCAEAGVLNVLPGIIGTMQAAEVLKIATGIGVPLANKILHYSLLQNNIYVVNISPNPNRAEITESYFSQQDFTIK